MISTGWTTEESEFLWGQELSPLHLVQTGSVDHLASYLMGTGGSFPMNPWVKKQGRKADHSTPTNVEVKKTWIYIHLPIRLHYVVLIKLHGDKFNFFLSFTCDDGTENYNVGFRSLV
jgi:hypothetical protein